MAISKVELLRRIGALLQGLRTVKTPGQETLKEFAEIEAEFDILEARYAEMVDNLMADRYRTHNRQPPVFNADGLSGVWGGELAKRRRSA